MLVEASWRWVFLVNVPVGVVALLAGALVLARTKQDSVTLFPDAVGAALLVISVGALTLGLVQGSEWGWSDGRITGAWIVAAVAFAEFLQSSRRHAEPVISPALLRVWTFSFANVTILLFSIPFAGALLANILWLQQVWGFSAITSAWRCRPDP